MENKLIITEESNDSTFVLRVSGRLDANNAAYLDDKLTELVQKGKYLVGLDMKGIDFLSSAGIRILVKQSKAFRAISGELTILVFSEYVQSVLDMVGMTSLFAPKNPVKKDSSGPIVEEELIRAGFRFKRKNLLKGPAKKLQLFGDPSKLVSCSFNETDNHRLKLKEPWFGLGIGAFGQDFEDCKTRYGEFLALGDCLLTLPSDLTVTADYMTRSGLLVPEINCLYGMGIENGFQQEIHFSPDEESSVSLGTLANTVAEMGNHRQFAMLLIAESNGLVGASIKTPPTSGIRPFAFPEVRENVKFTTEPAYVREMSISFGIFSKEPDDRLKPFVRIMGRDSLLYGHIHTAAFSYMPLRKNNPNYPESIVALMENTTLLDVLHLLNDNREINGIGESSFRIGYCWSTELTLE
jgi:anti-anti-sigma factor